MQHSRLLILLIAATPGSVDAAQRTSRFLEEGFAINGKSHWLVQVDTGGVLQIDNVLQGAAPQSLTASIGIDNIGSAISLGGGRVLIGGSNSLGQGALEIWGPGASGTMVREDELYQFGSDYCGAVYDAEAATLYLLDGNNDQIVRGDWSGTEPLASIAFTTWCDSTQVPALADADAKLLLDAEDGKLRLVDWPIYHRPVGAMLDELVPGVVVSSLYDYYATPFMASTGRSYPRAYVDQSSARAGGTSLSVYAETGIAFEIVDLTTGGAIGSGVGSATSDTVTVGLSSPLIKGRSYIAREIGQVTPTSNFAFECTERYGHSETLSDGSQFRSTFFHLDQRKGNSEFWMRTGLFSPTTQLTADVPYPAWVLVGFPGFGATLIPYHGDNVVIGGATILNARAWVLQHNGDGLAAANLPIPNDPSMIGLAFWFQFAILDASDIAVSEVYGSTIR